MKDFKKGDHVVMHTCVEAEHYAAKIWECTTDSYEDRGGQIVVFLGGFSGCFLCKYLQKVDIKPFAGKLFDKIEFGYEKVEEYFIRTTGYSGDSLLWWGKNSCGYTSDLRKAGRYTMEEAKEICITSKSELAYRVDKVLNNKEACFQTVHADYLKISDADFDYRPKADSSLRSE